MSSSSSMTYLRAKVSSPAVKGTSLNENLNSELTFSSGNRTNRCDTLLTSGKYLDNDRYKRHTWQPDTCVLHPYEYQGAIGSFDTCLRPGDEIIVAGDETAKHVYHALADILGADGHQRETQAELKSTNLTLPNGLLVRFLALPLLNEVDIEILRDISNKGLNSIHKTYAKDVAQKHNRTDSPQSYFFLTTGHTLLRKKVMDDAISLQSQFSLYFQIFCSGFLVAPPNGTLAFEKIYVAPPLVPYYPLLEGLNKQALLPEKVNGLVEMFEKTMGFDNESSMGGVVSLDGMGYAPSPTIHYMPVFNQLGGLNHPEVYAKGGVSYTDQTWLTMASILLNHMCNQKIVESGALEFKGTCCVDYSSNGTISQVKVATGVAVFFLAFLFMGASIPVFNSSNVSATNFSAPVFTLIAILVAAIYVYSSENTQAFAKLDKSFSPLYFLLLIQLVLGLGFGIRGSSPTPRTQEFKGACVLILLAIEISGYNSVHSKFEGTLLDSLMLTSWAATDVFSYTCQYLNQVFVPHSQKFSPARAFKFWAFKTTRIILLPAILSVAIFHKQNSSLSGLQGLFLVAPVSAMLLFWYAFIAVYIPVLSSLSAVFFGPTPDLEKLNWRYPRVTVFSFQAITVVLLGTVVYMLQSFVDNQVESGISALQFPPEQPKISNFWILYLATFAAWIFNFFSNENSGSFKVETTSKKGIIITCAVAALLLNYLFRAFKFPLPELTGADTVPSLVDFNPTVYADAIINHRGVNYTTAVHTIVSTVFLILVVALCFSLPKDFHSYVFGVVGSIGYEVLVLRRHALMSNFGQTLLYLISEGHEKHPVVNFQDYNMDYGLVSPGYPEASWAVIKYGVNLVVSVSVCIVLAKGCASYWNQYEFQKEEVGTSQKLPFDQEGS